MDICMILNSPPIFKSGVQSPLLNGDREDGTSFAFKAHCFQIQQFNSEFLSIVLPLVPTESDRSRRFFVTSVFFCRRLILSR